MADRYMTLVSGVPTAKTSLATSAGSGSSGAIPCLNASGLIDQTMLPVPTFASLTDGSSVSCNFASAPLGNAKLTLIHTTSTRVLNFTNLVNGGSYIVVLKQDSTGGAACTLGTGGTWYQGSAAGYVASTTLALTTTANAINILAFTYDGTNCYANLE